MKIILIIAKTIHYFFKEAKWWYKSNTLFKFPGVILFSCLFRLNFLINHYEFTDWLLNAKYIAQNFKIEFWSNFVIEKC